MPSSHYVADNFRVMTLFNDNEHEPQGLTNYTEFGFPQRNGTGRIRTCDLPLSGRMISSVVFPVISFVSASKILLISCHPSYIFSPVLIFAILVPMSSSPLFE